MSYATRAKYDEELDIIISRNEAKGLLALVVAEHARIDSYVQAIGTRGVGGSLSAYKADLTHTIDSLELKLEREWAS